MKIIIFGSVVASIISNAFGYSITCLLENAKYGTCISELKNISGSLSGSISMENAPQFCTGLKSANCKSFIDDIGVTTTACNANDEDKELASYLYSGRIGYLAYCVTDSQGNACPLSNYLLSQTSALNGESSLTTPSAEDLKIFSEDCKKDECNARLINLIELIKALNTFNNNEDITEKIPPEIDTIVTNYKYKKCDDLLNSTPIASFGGALGNTVSNSTTTTNNNNNKDNESSATKPRAIFCTISFVILLSILFFL